MSKCFITTIDNPFDPSTQIDDWRYFDQQKGYCSEAYLARIARTSDQFSDEENDAEIERAIDEIIRYSPLDIYKKIKIEE